MRGVQPGMQVIPCAMLVKAAQRLPTLGSKAQSCSQDLCFSESFEGSVDWRVCETGVRVDRWTDGCDSDQGQGRVTLQSDP
jgi:hypothetical protein